VQTQPIYPLAVLTIHIGVVVNNAILIVHQAVNNIRLNGMPCRLTLSKPPYRLNLFILKGVLAPETCPSRRL
jgi:hypothetical protein